MQRPIGYLEESTELMLAVEHFPSPWPLEKNLFPAAFV